MSEQPDTTLSVKYQLFICIDISARTFTASALKPDEEPLPALDFEQSPNGYTAFQKWLLGQGKDITPQQILLVMEATGTYWIMLATFLDQNGFSVAVVNHLQASSYVKSLPKRPKNDQIDAQSLARLALTHKPALSWLLQSSKLG